jgi:hypothetical protein
MQILRTRFCSNFDWSRYIEALVEGGIFGIRPEGGDGTGYISTLYDVDEFYYE